MTAMVYLMNGESWEVKEYDACQLLYFDCLKEAKRNFIKIETDKVVTFIPVHQIKKIVFS